MAAAGIGVDMLEISRMERALMRHPNFAMRIFSDEECSYCESRARPAEHYAARFAAREAVVKALGTGFSEGITWRDIAVTLDANGRPQVALTGRAAEVANELGIREIALSLSHTREVAIANAVAVSDAVRPQVDEKVDVERELLTSFKQARSVIDELERLQSDELAAVSPASTAV